MKRLILLAGMALWASLAFAQPNPNPSKAGALPPNILKPAPLETVGPLTPKGGADRPNAVLLLPWVAQEGVWRGDWQPVPGSPGAFTASWTRPNSREHPTARLHITLSQDRPGTMVVSIQRNGPDGACVYSGRFTSPTYANGTYHCNFGSRETLPWNATVTPP